MPHADCVLSNRSIGPRDARGRRATREPYSATISPAKTTLEITPEPIRRLPPHLRLEWYARLQNSRIVRANQEDGV